MMVLLVLSLAQVNPGAVSAAISTDETGRVCKSEVVTGSIVPNIVCKLPVQWQEEMRTDDMDAADLVAEYGVRRLNSWKQKTQGPAAFPAEK